MKKLYFILLLVLLIPFNSYSQYYFNQYASFDGANDYFATPSNTDLVLDSNFTISAWLYVQDTIGSNKTILSTVNSANSDGYSLLLQGSSSNPNNAGRFILNLNGINYSFIQTAGAKVILNGWTHFAVTFQNASPNNDTIRFYVNGTLVQNFYSNVPTISNTTDSLRVGNCYIPGSYSNAFRGYIDDLRIYKTFKAANIIANDRGIPIRMNGISNISLFSSSIYSRLSAAWVFDGNGNDGVGNSNNLTPTNGAGFINNSFNPNQYHGQGNFYMRFGGNWLTGEDVTNSIYDADTALTLEAWVYIDAYRATPQTIISKGTSAYSYNLSISSTPSNSPALILNSGAKFLQSSKQIPLKRWTHIAATYRASSGLMQIFINGNFDTSITTSPGNITTSNDSVYVGKNLFTDYLYGCLDEIRVSRIAKSQQQIQQYLYTSIDNLNSPAIPQACFGFEGNTIDNINNSLVLLPRAIVYFERLNTTAGAGGMHEAPLIRMNSSDFGFIQDTYNYNGISFSIPNGATVRDSILTANFSNGIYQVFVLIGHTNVGDLNVSLRNSSGTSVTLSSAIGGANNDMVTLFTNQYADSTINTNLAPFSQKIRPQNSLSALGNSSNGYVRLTITDNAAVTDSGRVYMWGLRFIPIMGIQNQNELPIKYELAQNYPNPFNPVTTIQYGLPKSSYVTLTVMDILGREVKILVDGYNRAGYHNVNFDGKNFSSGIYFYKLSAEQFTETKKMILIK